MRPSSSPSDAAAAPGAERAPGPLGSPPRPPERPFVQSLERGVRVLRALDAPGRAQTLSDVARATGLPRAAVRRFLSTLEQLGYVRGEDRRYRLTPRVLELGYAYLSGLSLPEIAQPHLRELVGRVDESCSMAVLDGAEIVYVAREPTRRIMTVTISIGTRFPAHATSMGRVLLADLPPARLRELLAAAPPRPLTAHTVTEPDRLVALIGEVGRRGWALVDQELEAGLRSIAAPVRAPDGHVAAAVNLSAHASRTTIAALRERLRPPLLETVAAIERDLHAGQA